MVSRQCRGDGMGNIITQHFLTIEFQIEPLLSHYGCVTCSVGRMKRRRSIGLHLAEGSRQNVALLR